jgi:hypothetical protein
VKIDTRAKVVHHGRGVKSKYHTPRRMHIVPVVVVDVCCMPQRGLRTICTVAKRGLVGTALWSSLSIRTIAVRGITNCQISGIGEKMKRTFKCFHDSDICGMSVLIQDTKEGDRSLQCCRLFSSSSSLCCTSVICVFMLQVYQYLASLCLFQ